MRRLLETLESRWRAESATPRIVIAANAPAELSRTVGPLIAGDLIRLAQDGNPVGMHLVLCEVHPHKLPEELLMHFPVRLVGRVVDREAARLASGRDDSGAEALPGEGHFIAITPDEIIRFRAAGCRLPEVQRAVRSLAARAASPKRAFAWKAMGV